MVAQNRNHWFQQAALNPVQPGHRLTERLRHYFDQHPEVSREDFLLGAIQKEMDFRSPGIVGIWPGNARPLRRGSSRWENFRRPPNAEDTRVHAWLAQRVLLIDRRRHSWREKVRRILSRNPLIHWVRRQVGLAVKVQ